MRNKLFGRLLSIVLSATLAFTPSITAFAGEQGELPEQPEETTEQPEEEEPLEAEPEEEVPEVPEETPVEEPEVPEATLAAEVEEEIQEEETLVGANAGYVDVTFQYDTGVTDVTYGTDALAGGEVAETGGELSLPSNLSATKKFHTLSGWSVSTDSTTATVTLSEDKTKVTLAQAGEAVISGPVAVTLTPAFDPKQYTVKYVGIERDNGSYTYAEGGVIPVPALSDDEKKAGYEFDAFYKGSDSSAVSEANKLVAPHEDVTTWSYTLTDDDDAVTEITFFSNFINYTVTFDPNGGKIGESTDNKVVTVVPGEKIAADDIPADPTKENLTFDGWYNGTSEFDKDAVVSGDVTYTAKWVAVVTYVLDGEELGKDEVVPGNKTTAPDYTVGAGYTFSGWFTDEDLSEGKEFDIATTNVDKNMTLYGERTANEYTVTLNVNKPTNAEGDVTGLPEGGSIKVTYDGTYSNLPTLTLDGYTFAGWFTAATGGEKVEATTKVTATENHTLYAHWIVEGAITVTFMVDGKQYGDLVVVDSSTKKATPPVDPTKTGYSFAYWSDADGEEVDFTEATFEESAVVYAVFTANEYTVTLNANKPTAAEGEVTGLPEGGSIKVTYDGEYSNLPAPELDNYTFAGWFTAATDGTKVNTTDKVEITEATTLYAHWTENEKYTVTFNSNGGSPVESQSVYEGKTATQPEDPAKVGYIFAGWYKDEALRTAYKFSTAVTENVTLYAKWTEVVYTFNFNSNLEKNTKKAVTYKISALKDGDKITAVKDLFGLKDEQAAKFDGWLTGSSFDGAPLIENEATVLSIITANPASSAKATVDLYAQWTEDLTNYYTIKFNANIGDDPFDVADFAGSSLGVANLSDLIKYEEAFVDQNIILSGTEFVRKGYVLKGWQYTNGTKTITTKPAATLKNLAAKGETVELKAIWDGPKSYTIKYSLNGGKYTGAGKLQTKYTYASPIELPTADEMTKVGYTFGGWDVLDTTSKRYAEDETGIGKGYGIETGNVTAYAYWLTNDYNVAFDKNGGTISVSDFNARYNYSYSLKGVTYSKDGYKFKNWTYTDDKGKTKTIAAAGTIKNLTAVDGKTVVLTANWTPIKYSITYNLGSGAKQVKPVKSYTNDKAETIFINSPTRPGYTFDGWILTQKGIDPASVTARVEYYDGDVLKGAYLTDDSYGNVILTADWEPTLYTLTAKDGENTAELANNKTFADTIDFTGLVSTVNGWKEGQTVKGFALTPGGKVSYALNKTYKIGDIVKALKIQNDATKTEIVLYPVFEAEKYFVTATANVGDYSKSYSFDPKKGVKVTAPAVTGYTITGWTLNDSALETAATAGTDYTIDAKKNITIKAAGANKFKDGELQAQFESNKYKIILVPNAADVKASSAEGADTIAKAGIEYKSGDTVVEISYNDPTANITAVVNSWVRTGYTLEGFATAAKGKVLEGNKVGGLNLKKDKNGFIKLYAIWSANGKSIDYNAGAPIVVNNSASTMNIEAEYAKFAASVKSYTFGKEVKLPTIKKTGYKFLGWKIKEGSSTDGVSVDTNKAGYVTKIRKDNNADVSLVAYFDELTYKLSLNPNGGVYNGSKKATVLKEKVLYSENIYSLIPDTSDLGRSGYETPEDDEAYALVAKGPKPVNSEAKAKKWLWYYGYAPMSGNTIMYSTKAVTIYPQWTKVTVYKPTNVVASYNGNSLFVSFTGYNDLWHEVQYSTNMSFLYGVTTATLTPGNTYASITSLTGSKYYARVRSYYIDSTGAKVYSPWSNTVAAAKSSTSLVQYTTQYFTGSTQLGEDITGLAPAGENALSVLGKPSYPGYTWDGKWLKGADEVDEATTIAANVVFKASFTANTYKVKFDKNDTKATGNMSEQTFTYDVAAQLTENAYTKENYTFVGWNTKPNGTGTPYSDTQSVIKLTTVKDAAITLYAQWEGAPLTVTFKDGATTVDTKAVYYDSTYGELPTPTKTGYAFAGWYTTAEDTEETKGELITSSTKVTKIGTQELFARWAADKYTVKFNPNYSGSPVSTSILADYQAKVLELKGIPTVTRTGYLFAGWYDAAEGGNKVTEDTIVTAAVTYYAHWIIKDFSLSSTGAVGKLWDQLTVAELQSDVTFAEPSGKDGSVAGTLNYVTWQNFMGQTDDAHIKGYYLYFKVEGVSHHGDNPTAKKIEARLTGDLSDSSDFKELPTNDEGQDAVFRIADKSVQDLEVRVTYSDGDTATKKYDLSGLVLANSLTAGQVAPTATSADGNATIATAWTAASGKEASGNMVAANNDYHIGVWYVALTGLDASKTYYLVREYLDGSGNVLAADWGSYTGVTEKFVYSSWGMNLQNASYQQKELKETITGITADVAKVRFTLTEAVPSGQGTCTAAIALGWPETAEGETISGTYKSIDAIAEANILRQETVTRSGEAVDY